MLKLSLPDNDREPDIDIRIGWPPSANNFQRSGVILPREADMIARVASQGWPGFWRWLRSRIKTNTFMLPTARVYREEWGWKLAKHRRKLGSGPVAMELVFYPPTKREPDIDNNQKAVLDMLEYAAILEDDKQVAQLLLTRAGPMKGGEVEVRAWKIPGGV